LKYGKVVYIAAEDPEIVLWHRLRSLAVDRNGELKMPDYSIKALMQNLQIVSAVGKGISLGDKKKQDWQIRIIERYRFKGIRLIILDTLSRVHTLNENDNGEMAGLLQTIEVIAKETGAAILFLHHVNKSSAASGDGDKQQAARGASVITDNARFGASLTKMTVEESERIIDRSIKNGIIGESRQFYIKLCINKNNYGRPIDDTWYFRGDGGVLEKCEIEVTDSHKNNNKKSGNKNHNRKTMDEDDDCGATVIKLSDFEGT
jgi:RecA-family ATPase